MNAYSLVAVSMVLILAAAPIRVLAETRSILFPVQGNYSFRDDFAEPRDGGAREHLGVDVIANKMTPLVAAVTGTITFIAIPQASWGYSITIRDSDGYTYRYLHMNNDSPGTDDGAGGVEHAYAPGLHRGSQVLQGDIIGWVGDSGNAENTISHLHFEIHKPDRSAIDPYESLLAASGGMGSGGTSPVITQGAEAGLEEEELFVERRQLQEGMVDKDVATLNSGLKSLGYFSGAVTETYTSETREAVRNFQRDNKIEPTGIADALTRRTLERLTIATASAPASSSELSLGSRGDTVTELQKTLKTLGYFSSDVTGYFGPITKAAVIAFQKANGIDPLGIVGPKTRAALTTGSAPPQAGTYVFTKYLEFGARGEDVRQLQLFLTHEGFFHEDATGYFGSITKKALEAYQTAHDIEALGIVGPKTRVALNAAR